MFHHNLTICLMIVVSVTLIFAGCLSDERRILVGGPPSLPAAQAITKVRCRQFGSARWNVLPVEIASALLPILLPAQELSYADGTTLPMGAMDREVQFITNDNREFTVVLRSDNDQFWCAETTEGRVPSAKSYVWLRGLSTEERSILSSLTRKSDE
jgi:hypothetical protein